MRLKCLYYVFMKMIFHAVCNWIKTSCEVLNLKVQVYKDIVSQKKESTHWNESFFKHDIIKH